MSLFWVTGSAATGKSTVSKALRERGYVSYDVDNDALARWTNLSTGYVHPKSSVKPEQRTPEFLNNHRWFVPRAAIEEIQNEANGKLGFICGVLDNYEEIQDLIDGIIALWVDDETIKERFKNRGPREWGHQQHEIDSTIKGHQTAYDEYRAMGAVVIESSKPFEQVVDEVVSAATSLSNRI